MESHIYRDISNYSEFDYSILDYTNTDKISYKENGIQFRNIDFRKSTFRITSSFIEICKEKIQEQDLLNKKENQQFIKIELDFKNCMFTNFIIKEQVINADISFTYDKDSINLEIEKFIIFGSKIEGKFYINKQYSGKNRILSIHSFKMEDTTFKENFKFHNIKVTKFNIEDIDFERHADFFKSIFKKGILNKNSTENINQGDIGFKAVNFRGLALFGNTEFYKKLIFKYVTFESFSHFRESKIHAGLDLDYANIQEEMNFFDVIYIDKINTSQETYRIIKHNFEKIGNKIEANKFHALELSEHRKNIWNTKDFSISLLLDGIVNLLHWISSNHSTNWLISLIWIFIIGLLTTVGITQEFNIYDISTYSFIRIDRVFTNMQLVHFGHDTFTFIIDYKQYKSTFDSSLQNKIILFCNKISLGYLYYQFLISLRKDTRK